MYRWINAAAGIAQGDIDTRALIVEGSQIRLPEANAVMCCQADVGEQVLDAVLAGTTSIGLDLVGDDLTPLADLGISELIGEFTTAHPRRPRPSDQHPAHGRHRAGCGGRAGRNILAEWVCRRTYDEHWLRAGWRDL